MSEPLIHFVIPFSAFTMSGISSRRAAFASLFALLPDLDVLTHVHRSMTHSILILAAIILPAVLLTWRTKYRIYALLAGAGLASHLALDLFSLGYTPILWPIYDQGVQLYVLSATHIDSGLGITFNAGILTQPATFEFRALDAPIFTGEGLIIAIILLVPVLLTKLAKSHRQSHR